MHEVLIGWPRPHIFDSFGARTLGYSGEVILPLTVIPRDPAKSMDIRLSAELGVCKDMCVLEHVTLAATILPDAPASDGGSIGDAWATVPGNGAPNGLAGFECAISGTGTERRLDGAILFDVPAPEAIVIIEGTDQVWINGTDTTISGDRIAVQAELSLASPETWIDRSRLRATVLARDFSADLRGCTAPRG